MNILELLKNEKVEWKTLGEVCEIKRGRILSKTYLEEHVGRFPVYSSQTRNNGEIGRIDTYDFDGEYATWTTDGAYAGTVFYRSGKFSITNICGLINPKEDSKLMVKFVVYWLQIEAKKHVKGGSGNPKLMSNEVEKIAIPIPAIETQEKIVKTLDKFTNYVTELQAELQAELQDRTLQYNYYRDKLLSEEYLDKMSNEIREFEVKWGRLEDLLYYEQPTKYIVSSTEYDKSYNIPVLTAGQKFILGYTNENEGICCADKNDPVIIFDDFTTDNKWVDFNFKVKSSAMKILRPKDNTNLRYCYYYMSTIKSDITEHKRMWISEYSKTAIPIPPPAIQQKVVNILDKFQDILKDTEGLLPAEIEQRQKQYEYYREKLLTFNTEDKTIFTDRQTDRQSI